ncbi:hypothetical protein [Mycolicibacterium sp.]|nr:hypothetical protein [Mycolicibacterium sp.]
MVFADEEAALLLAAPTRRYQVPIYAAVKVARDYPRAPGPAATKLM